MRGAVPVPSQYESNEIYVEIFACGGAFGSITNIGVARGALGARSPPRAEKKMGGA